MSDTFSKGDSVKWRSHGGEAHGKVTKKQVEELMAKGAVGGLFFQTEDCQAMYEELKSRGVEFTAQARRVVECAGTDVTNTDPAPIRLCRPRSSRAPATGPQSGCGR